jgi:hypothetical protein
VGRIGIRFNTLPAAPTTANRPTEDSPTTPRNSEAHWLPLKRQSGSAADWPSIPRQPTKPSSCPRGVKQLSWRADPGSMTSGPIRGRRGKRSEFGRPSCNPARVHVRPGGMQAPTPTSVIARRRFLWIVAATTATALAAAAGCAGHPGSKRLSSTIDRTAPGVRNGPGRRKAGSAPTCSGKCTEPNRTP